MDIESQNLVNLIDPKINFSYGMPSEHMLPKDFLCFLGKGVNLSQSSLQYSSISSSLKSHISVLMGKRGVKCSSDQILITSGSQQALLILSLFLSKKYNTAIYDELTYPGYKNIIERLKIRRFENQVSFLDGADINCLEKYLSKHPKSFIYSVINGHNPLGINLTDTKKQELSCLSEKFGAPVIEDDIYGFISYEKKSLPLKIYQPKNTYYVGSFSKILFPSARVGWIISDRKNITELEKLQETIDLSKSTIGQSLITKFLDNFDFNQHLSNINTYYKLKRNLIIQCLRSYLPEIYFTEPQAGFFVWCEFPEQISTRLLLNNALKKYGISFFPGDVFSKNVKYKNCLRLSFSNVSEEQIIKGIKLLKELLKNY